MKKRKAVVLAAVVLAVCIGSLFYVRQVDAVNAATPAPSVSTVGLNEQTLVPSSPGHDGNIVQDGFLVSAEDSYLLTEDEVATVIPGYKNYLIESAQAKDMRALVVKVRIKNTSDEALAASLPDIVATKDTWTNGVEGELFAGFNNSAGLSPKMQPGEELCVFLPYALYDMQFGFSDAWMSIDSHEFHLVLSCYPEKKVVDLGTPSPGEELVKAVSGEEASR